MREGKSHLVRNPVGAGDLIESWDFSLEEAYIKELES